MDERQMRAKIDATYERIAEVDRPEIWISLRERTEVLAEAAALASRLAAGDALPLAGKLLAVKGNIDVAGLPTTAGCPGYATMPERDATAVARLRAAGAIVLGTTNLDQFATGLVGTRSPYGAVRNAIDPTRISGGSSSGSAVAVALGIVDIALGTDTAGSGRVPAALNGIVGIKPTRGLVSIRGVVPACRSLDCVTVFARSLDEATEAAAVMAGPDPADPTSRTPPTSARPRTGRVGVPRDDQLGELAPGWRDAWQANTRRLAESDVELVSVDLAPFLDAARLLYEGAFVAERYTAVGEFIDAHRDDPRAGVDPTVAAIITAARQLPAHELFADLERLDELRIKALAQLDDLDALLLPTTTEHPTLAEVAADPIGVNSRLGRFTNFANLLDMCAVAIPGGKVAGLPFGVMLVGRAFADGLLAELAGHFDGGGDRSVSTAALRGTTRVVVAGAHLSGQPLNGELTSRGGRLVATTSTASRYRLHALRVEPAKPGLERVPTGGTSIEVEIWELPIDGFGELVSQVPQPMAIGSVELADGSRLPGFVCEPTALHGATDITDSHGWRAFLDAEQARTR